MAPQVALQRLEIRRLDIARDEVSDMRLERGPVVAVFLRERLSVGRKRRTIPLLV